MTLAERMCVAAAAASVAANLAVRGPGWVACLLCQCAIIGACVWVQVDMRRSGARRARP